ncbi:MAG TPA: hypothetical protein DIT55_02730 [Spirochaetaceae bacterium]|nr:hypothetical protein [Spirochaetaceae bacterium]
MAEERISIGTVGPDLIIIPVGHITAFLCPKLQAKAMEKLGPDSAVASIRFDFSSCLYMDSTFLGLIVLLAKAMRSRGIGRPIMHSVSAECRSLFRTMGMMKMLEFSEEACPQPVEKENILTGDGLSTGFLYDAHMELSGISVENEKRFQNLTKELKEDLDSMNDLTADRLDG